MKKLFLSLAFIGSVAGLWAQEAADKEIQAGIVLGYGMNFQKMGTKYLQSDGIGSDWTIGANVNFSFTETIGFSTGVEFDFESLKYNLANGDTVIYAYDAGNNQLYQTSEYEEQLDGSESYYMLSSRKQRPMYITIPTMLVFRTKFIGYFRYFGKFGLRTSILVSNKFTDNGSNINPNTGVVVNDVNNLSSSDYTLVDSQQNKDMKAKSEMFPIKSAVGLAGGAEWNFVGATTLMAEIGYYYGFTPLYNNREFMLNSGGPNNTSDVGNNQYFANKATQSQLMFKISILF